MKTVLSVALVLLFAGAAYPQAPAEQPQASSGSDSGLAQDAQDAGQAAREETKYVSEEQV